MNNFQSKLFEDLERNVRDHACFISKDRVHKESGRMMRLYAYRVPSLSQWSLSNALNCRGTMFDVSDPSSIELVCLPMKKFFDLEEHEGEIKSPRIHVQQKHDGSLMSSFFVDGQPYLKSRYGLTSPQVEQAYRSEDWQKIRGDLDPDRTSNFEWTSPDNQVVVKYEKERLFHLHDRLLVSGFQCCYSDDIGETFFLRLLREENFEGAVLTFKGGLQCRVKNPWFVARHALIDRIESDNQLFKEITEGIGTKTLSALFKDNPRLLSRIDKMSAYVSILFARVDDFESFARRELICFDSAKDMAAHMKEQFAEPWQFSLGARVWRKQPIQPLKYVKKIFKKSHFQEWAKRH